MRIKNSVVVITGAASGIGRATALRFARRRTSLVLASRRVEALESLVAECAALGSRAIAVPTDTSDHDAVQELASRAVEEFGRIDVWVNNAAVSFFSPFLEVPLRDFERVIDVNVMGYVYGARAALERMQDQGSGVLVNVASIVGEVPQPYTSAYSVSKAAVRALGVSLRSELTLDRKKHIHVCRSFRRPSTPRSSTTRPTTRADAPWPCLRSTARIASRRRSSTSSRCRPAKSPSGGSAGRWCGSTASCRGGWRS